MIDWDSLANRAYNAYSRSTDNKNFLGKEMPVWSDLPLAIRIAWTAAVKQVIIDVATPLLEEAKQ